MRKMESVPIFLDYDQAQLDAQYGQRTFIPHAEEIIQRYGAASDAVRARLGEPETLAYGPSAAEALDLYGRDRKKIVVFVHGGAWKRQRRRDQAFAAETFVNAGAAYAAVGFGLLPSITLPEMAAQVRQALIFIEARFKPEKLVLVGHSSGAHLSACALTRTDFVKAALLISGPYDLLPVRLSARNEYVRLDERLEDEYSPNRHVDRIRCPVTVAWSEKEGAEFTRQSKTFAAALESRKLLVQAIEAKGLNHFEIVETLADPASLLGRAALTMLA
jgi:arylformamidase